jgi:PAS domain S-box-containing protein
MQALSENSVDMILRIDIFNRFTYVNPVVEEYTRMKKDDFNNKPINEVGLDEEVVTFFKNMMDEIARMREKKIGEMEFNSENGIRLMEVSAIPEYQDNGEIESVLFVCHDITEARNREDIIKKKNKSIADSINYAYYIQDALMPTEEGIRKIIPNSFMMYRPKDVVSGDYPFMIRKDDVLYLGAMDCTGHGVPGALMSIIGYFLQNQIINMNPDDNAGAILDMLHKNVVESLKQDDEDSMINDGMDAAFCKIDFRKGILNYAGAHRPLYYVSKGEFTEIRGDRFPVGSTQYTNRKKFTNHAIKIKQGDTFYMMTDGYADQYGGPSGKQKFLSGRVSLMIKDNTHLSLAQMEKLFIDSYEDWKGEVSQVDDVLVMGFKF